eukprot:SAG11_NODE_4422_length_1901_cov_3.248613_1_plen_304_part_00
MTVGISNVLSGLSGGYTGSYIISSTQLALKAGVSSKLLGVAIVCTVGSAAVLPLLLMTFIPAYLFAGVLSAPRPHPARRLGRPRAAAGLTRRHLRRRRSLHRDMHDDRLADLRQGQDQVRNAVRHPRRLRPAVSARGGRQDAVRSGAEFAIVWLSFVAINIFDILPRFCVGVLFQLLFFVVHYARNGLLLRQRHWTSNVIRGFSKRSLMAVRRLAHGAIGGAFLEKIPFHTSNAAALKRSRQACNAWAAACFTCAAVAGRAQANRREIVMLQCHGYLFFGSAVRCASSPARRRRRRGRLAADR